MKNILAGVMIVVAAITFSAPVFADANAHKVPEAKKTGGNIFADMSSWEKNVVGKNKAKGASKTDLTIKNKKAVPAK
ncbi:MAG: hypothetical protein PHS37_06550 [Candidatus Omnitrophica bacterium]|nr:hypothetical protein [Candidatus Omnitrophota bacterium]